MFNPEWCFDPSLFVLWSRIKCAVRSRDTSLSIQFEPFWTRRVLRELEGILVTECSMGDDKDRNRLVTCLDKILDHARKEEVRIDVLVDWSVRNICSQTGGSG